MASYTGYIDHIIYRNDANGYTVFELEEGKTQRVCVGTLDVISEGEYVEITGEEVVHPVYDKQIKIERMEIRVPEDEDSILRYLGSGAIKGIGMKLADRIVRRFGKDTLQIIEQEPERLAEVKGISIQKAMEMSDQMEEKRDMRSAMMYLQKFGISTPVAIKIYNEYGNRIYDVIEKNPYKLADDVDGIGFKAADEIARQAGVDTESDFRIRSGIVYALLQAAADGHTYLPKEILKKRAQELLNIAEFDMDHQLVELAIEKKVIVKETKNQSAVYATHFYKAEASVARMLLDLNFKQNVGKEAAYKKIEKIEEELGFSLDEQQKEAIYQSLTNGVLVITGGPGTGKTTTINAIISYFEQRGDIVRLAAPTGRAAKRMTEATGYEAQTIHRMLEFSGGSDAEGGHFERNEDNCLDADVVIVDEMSMVDIFLMNSLLKAIAEGTRLILVGDVDQLPSVSPGNVLKDIIASETFAVVLLNTIFRQANESEIVTNAHRINKGQPVEITNKKDFLYIERNDPGRIAGVITTLIREKLPKYTHSDMLDIQVLTPSRIGNLGTMNLNRILQEVLNPDAPGKVSKEHGAFLFREGDKVMQIKNNYQLQWEKRNQYGIALEEGLGVFNGDMGIIKKINLTTELMEIEYDDEKFVTYSFKDLDELELAYAITVHKSQGSEYPAVIIPVLSGPRMLMNRNVLYTAVTRAKSCVCLVGLMSTIQSMIQNVGEYERFSGLDERIKEITMQEMDA